MNLEELIKSALIEDIQDGDHSSLACIPANAKGSAKLLIKDTGVLAGVEIAREVFQTIDPNCSFEIEINDGTSVQPGQVAFVVHSTKQNILKGERLALNYMQRMSGIATETRRYVDLIAHTSTKLLDTRKTTPNNRVFEKMAVKIGGGHNHRFGLYDMIMLKDNHIDFAGGIEKAINQTNDYLKSKALDLKIEIEVRDIAELKEVLSIGKVHRIMLDNFSIPDTITALNLIDGKYETESSGGINENTIVSYAETGVDYISVGALTHHIKSLDLSLKSV